MIVWRSMQGPMGPMHNSSQTQQLIILVVLLLLVVIIVMLYRWPRPAPAGRKDDEVEKEAEGETDEPGSVDKLEVALRLLDENERKVVEALVAEGGSILQKDISIDLGFSRVKTHRVVQSLVKRGLITAEEHFNTNKVTLVDWLRE